MNTRTKTAALLLMLGSAWLWAPLASAQLGSLVVTITSPAAGSTVSGTTTVSASVTIIGSLTVAGVQFKLDGVNLGAEDTSASYQVPWNTTNASNGSHTLTAVARDLLGVRWTSDPVTVTVFNDTSPPSVSIASPTSGATVGGTIPVTASASDNIGVVGVQFRLDGANLGAEDTTTPYSISWNTTTASNGSHTLTARARDAAGNTATSAAVTVTVFNDTSPPTVSITSPASGATVSGTISVTTNASDNVGVAGVQFRLDGVNLGAEDTTAPYSVTWNTTTISNGSHTLTARARDAAGNTATSAAVTVTVFNDTSPPTVSITSPGNGVTVGGTVTVSASASDNVGVAGVQFRLDGADLGAEDATAPYSASWNTTTATNGSHTLTAIARDAAGNATTSAAVTVTVSNDTTPPTVTITSPSSDATVSGTTSVTANASDNVGVAGVQFFLDGAALGAEDTTAPYAVSWNTTTASNGSHTLTARARDAAGNTTTSAAVTVTVFNDTTPPTVSTTSPSSGTTVSATISVTASASDDVGVAGVQFFVDGAPLGAEDTSAPYEVAWDTTTATNGSHTLTAIARDAAGNTTTSAAVTVTVSNDTTPPTVAITSPASGAAVSDTISVTANASDNVGVVGVQFRLDGANLGAEDTTVPYSVSWNTTTATNGSHTLTAVARDAAGNASTSDPVAVTVDNESTGTVIRIEESSPDVAYVGSWTQGYAGAPGGWSGGTIAFGVAVGERATLNFSGTGVSWVGFRGSNVGIANVYLDGPLVATVDGYATTETVQAVFFAANELASGPHTLTIEVTRTKNDASSDYLVVVDAFDVTSPGGGGPGDTTSPTISITSHADGATVSGMAMVTAGASDNVGVAGVQFFVDGVQVGAEDMAAPYEVNWNTSTTSNGGHTLTAVARDAAGNTATSAPISVTVSNAPPPPPAPAATRIEDTDLAITYTPGTVAPGQPPAWFHGSRSRDWSSATASFNRSAGSRATIAFTGTSISWIGFRAFWAGIARVFLDGVFVAEVDLFLPPCTAEQRAQGCIDQDDQAPVFTATGLAAGPHTLTVEATGGRNAGATDNAVVVDAFDVAPASPPPTTGTRIEETAAAMTYTAGWTQGDTTTAWSGGTAAVSTTAGARATVTFIGTELRWVGRRGPQAGIARIFLDGGLQAEFDQYYPTEVQGTNYTATGLAPGAHTLTIEVTGLKNAASTGTLVTVDAFDARSRFEERDASVTYNGLWAQEHMDRPWSGTSPNTGGGTAARSATAGASAEFTFSGSEVHWISSPGPTAGIADVSLDGVIIERVDLYAPVEALRVAVFTATGLGPGPHTLRIDVTGLRNDAATGAFVAVDAFEVTLPVPSPVVSRLQQTDASVTYTTPPSTAGFSQSSANGYFSGRTVAFSTTPGSRATFTFTGTAVRWIGQRRRDSGIARVYLDGVLIGEVDTFSPIQDEFQAAVFSATGLSPGVAHTLTIEVTGTKRGGDSCTPGPGPSPPPCSAGHVIVVDAFEIY